MGTRFTVADESIYAEHKKQLVLDTRDGGIQTLKYVNAPVTIACEGTKQYQVSI